MPPNMNSNGLSVSQNSGKKWDRFSFDDAVNNAAKYFLQDIS